jgi:prepilin signal peptidase PulO-like enzyme (type II secretory pathway)
VIYLFLLILGIIIGSFLNVAGLRYNSGLGVGGRSMCLSCGETLRWHELIPVVSYFWRLGRCRSCRSLISAQYPIVEIMTGVSFVAIYRTFFIGDFISLIYCLLVAVIFCLYIVIGIYDLRHRIIPDLLVYSSILLSCIADIVQRVPLHDLLAGPILFLFFFVIWLVSKGRAMGLGDAKLGLSIGLLLGLVHGLSALAFSFWFGTVAALVVMITSKAYPLFMSGKRITMKSEIPFAPFLVIGALAAIIFHVDLFHLSAFFK